MSDGNLNISWTADEQDLAKAQSKLIKQQEEMIDKYKKLVTESKKGGKERQKAEEDARKELERFAAATMKINRTPLERYKEEMFKLNTALKAGKIDQETFTRAVSNAKTELSQAGEAGKKAFGTDAMAAVSRYMTGMLTLSGVVGGIFKTFQDAMQISEEMATKQREDTQGIGPLAQLAMGDKDRMRELIKSTRMSFAQGAGLSLAEAGKLQFEIASQNYEQYRKQIAELKATNAIPDPIGLVVGAAALETNVGPSAGGFPRITSMLMGAAGKSPGEIPAIATASAEAAGTGVFLGLSPQEIMAASAVAAKASGSPEEGGMLMKNLFKGIEGKGMREGGLVKRNTLLEYMHDIAALEAQGKRDYEILGEDIRTFTGYRKLKAGLNVYKETLADVDKAVNEDLFRSTTEMWKAVPELIGPRAERQAEAGLQEEYARDATFTNLAQSIRKDMKADIHRRGGMMQGAGRLGAHLNDWIAWGEQLAFGSEAFVRMRGFQGSQDTQEMIRLTYEALRESADSQREAAAELRDAAKANTTARQRAAAAVTPE